MPLTLIPKRTFRTRESRTVMRLPPTPTPLAATLTQSAAVQAPASGTVNTSQPTTATSHAGPYQLWSRTLTIVPFVSGGACEGLMDSPRNTQFCAPCTSRLRSRGTWPGSAATVIVCAL